MDEELCTFYNVLHEFESKVDEGQSFPRVKRKIAEAWTPKISQKRYETGEDLKQLLADFLKIANDSYDGVIIALVSQIFNLVQKMLKMPKKLPIEHGNITKFFMALNRRETPQSYERNIRRIFMIKLREDMKRLSSTNLIEICVELNKMDHFDL